MGKFYASARLKKRMFPSEMFVRNVSPDTVLILNLQNKDLL